MDVSDTFLGLGNQKPSDLKQCFASRIMQLHCYFIAEKYYESVFFWNYLVFLAYRILKDKYLLYFTGCIGWIYNLKKY